MLKNTERYLKDEIISARNELKKESALFNERKGAYEKHNDILKTWKNINISKNNIGNFLKIIGVLIMGCLFFNAVVTSVFAKIVLLGIYGGLGALFTFGLVHEIIDYKKNNNKFRNSNEYSEENFRHVGNTKKPVLQYTVDYEKSLVDESFNDISSIQEYIHIIEEILESEDYIDIIAKYKEEKGYFTDALLAEWDSYLEELQHIKPEKVDLTRTPLTEDCYKEATEKYHVDIKKLEKKNKAE